MYSTHHVRREWSSVNPGGVAQLHGLRALQQQQRRRQQTVTEGQDGAAAEAAGGTKQTSAGKVTRAACHPVTVAVVAID